MCWNQTVGRWCSCYTFAFNASFLLFVLLTQPQACRSTRTCACVSVVAFLYAFVALLLAMLLAMLFMLGFWPVNTLRIFFQIFAITKFSHFFHFFSFFFLCWRYIWAVEIIFFISTSFMLVTQWGCVVCVCLYVCLCVWSVFTFHGIKLSIVILLYSLPEC